MTVGGRLVVRIVSHVSYLVIGVAVFTFLISDISWIRWSGVFLALFLTDRFLHFREADIPFSELPPRGKVNLARYLRPKAFSLLERAFDRSVLAKRNFFLEMIRQLVHFREIEEGLRRLDVKPEEFSEKIDEFLSKTSGDDPGDMSQKSYLRSEAEDLVFLAFPIALRAGHDFIEPSDLFSALPQMDDEHIGRLFQMFSLNPGDLEKALLFGSSRRLFRWFRRIPRGVGGMVLESHRRMRHRIMNRAWTSRPTPTLDRYGVDFTDLARERQVGFLVGREAEYERLVETLARPVNPNALLVGEAGIGKEALVAHLAFRLVKDEVPPELFDKRLVGLELSNLVAGSTPADLQTRIQKIAEEIMLAGNIVLYIPDIHNLVNTSGTAYLSAADAFMPIVLNNAFPIVGSTYPREYKTFIEPRSDFAGAFEVIRVSEVSEEDAEKILVYESMILERQSGIFISFGAVKRSVKLAKKFMRNKFLPASGEELLKSALIEAERRGEKYLGPDIVVSTAETKVNVPIHEAGKAEARRLLNLESVIHERLVDQDEAVKAVSDALREYRSGLSRKGGPIASFLFVGPTGVGKTELAKILAKVQFGSENLMARFDMTEYQDKQSFYRFIGSPDGKTRGALTEAILEKPYSLILLDEFEKAYPDILNLFLQVFDDGRLTDNLGQTVSFENTIIIATSNAHSDIIMEALRQGQPVAQVADYLKRRLTDVFRPELLNRFSKVVVFRNLAPDDLEKISALNLKDVADAVREQGITISFDDSVVRQFAKWGYDPVFGARPLRGMVSDKLRALLAEKILRGELVRGAKLRCQVNNEKIEFVSDRP